jgi:hypothetical protein
LIIPSPVDDTDSDEQAPQSAQNLTVQAEHGGNSVKLFRGSMDTVQAEMVQIAGEMIPISLLTAKMLLCDPRRNPFFMLQLGGFRDPRPSRSALEPVFHADTSGMSVDLEVYVHRKQHAPRYKARHLSIFVSFL